MIGKFFHRFNPLIRLPFSQLKSLNENYQLSQQQIDSILGNQVTIAKPNKQSTQPIPQQDQQLTSEKPLFYGLIPKVNEQFPVCVDPDYREIQETPNQNIFKFLSLPDHCSFDDYASSLSTFRQQSDLYGDQSPPQTIQNADLQFKALLQPSSKYLQRARKNHMVNISIPGTIECEDPRNFMELRPVEEFRHTPLIPISESAMRKHKQMLEDYHRRQFVFEVSTQSILNWVLIFAACCVGGYMIFIIMEKEEERTVAYSRLKYQRIKGESQDVPIFKI